MASSWVNLPAWIPLRNIITLLRIEKNSSILKFNEKRKGAIGVLKFEAQCDSI